jgi:type II secretion system protein G
MKFKSGFTLIELLVVIAIIGLLASVVIASLNPARAKARDERRISDMKQIQLALELYYDTNGIYPNMLAYVSPTVDVAWSTSLASALSPYLSILPKETILNSGYLYSSTNVGQKYGLATGLENSSNSLLTNDGGFYAAYYELGPSPSDCASAGKDWWGSAAINCP